ncbi:MAG: M48 family metallopeptidase [Alishewanella agri]|nr:M48 family metallopeptidase [Alishewanella agri]
MKTINTVALILSSLLVVSGCKTLDGAGRAFGNLTGSKLHEKFEGTYISQNSLQPLKERQDKLSGSGDLISYSGLNIPEDHVRKVHIVDAPALTAYLQDILNRLIQHWDGVPVKVKVQIVSTQNFAPYADAYGTISVPLGMLENVESEDEIASLLAHEVSHILLRHHERSEVMNTQKDQVTLLAKSVMLANVAKDTKIAKIGGKYDVKYNASKQGQENITNAALYNYLINGFSDSVWNTAWQRAQEDEADLLAIDLATSAGYAPRASSYNLQRLSDFQGKQKSILSAFWEEKTTALKTSIQQLDLNSLTTQADSIINEGVGTMLTAASDFFQRSHMSPERRDLNLREYVRREYGGESRKVSVTTTTPCGVAADQ